MCPRHWRLPGTRTAGRTGPRTHPANLLPAISRSWTGVAFIAIELVGEPGFEPGTWRVSDGQAAEPYVFRCYSVSPVDRAGGPSRAPWNQAEPRGCTERVGRPVGRGRSRGQADWSQPSGSLLFPGRFSWSLADRLGEDLVRGLDPGKGAGSGVPVGGKQVDLGDELLDRTEASAPDRPAGEDPEPGLDLVHPGRRRRGEVEGGPRMPFEPGADVGRLVGADVVEDDMELPVG